MTTQLSFYPSKRAALETGYTLTLREERVKIVRGEPLIRRVIARMRGEVERERVKSVHVHSGLSEVTPAQRRRIDEVRQALDEGRNPYEHDADTPIEDAGGLANDRQRRLAERMTEPTVTSDAMSARAAIKWADKTASPRSQTVRRAMHALKGVDIRTVDVNPWPTITTPDGRVIPDPDLAKCSFCGTYLPRNDATTGKGPLQETWKDEVREVYGIQVVTRKLVKWSNKLVACYDCCLKIRPTVGKDGSLVNNVDIKSRE